MPVKINPVHVVVVVIVAVVAFSLWSMNGKINDLESEVKTLVSQKAAIKLSKEWAESESKRLALIIDAQSSRIAKFEHDESIMNEEIVNWRQLAASGHFDTPEVKEFKEIVKITKSEDDMCKNVGRLMESIKGLTND